jgi:hypothetical protein
LRKVVLFMTFLAISMLLCGTLEVYATISNLRTTAGTSEQPVRNTIDSKISCSQPNLRICGDPITDPRPISTGPPKN